MSICSLLRRGWFNATVYYGLEAKTLDNCSHWCDLFTFRMQPRAFANLSIGIL
ncbi:hypothetical protein BDQ17DRAFT_1364547 [Cyathus striatus]|nr:hypothetical protein BDQ17DRAFT_1364547 [Cyathus striatus]